MIPNNLISGELVKTPAGSFAIMDKYLDGGKVRVQEPDKGAGHMEEYKRSELTVIDPQDFKVPVLQGVDMLDGVVMPIYELWQKVRAVSGNNVLQAEDIPKLVYDTICWYNQYLIGAHGSVQEFIAKKATARANAKSGASKSG